MEEQINIPKLRFPEFQGEWEKKRLEEVAEKQIKKNSDNQINNVFTNSAVNGILNQRDFFDKDIANQNNLAVYYIVKKNDFIYNPRISNFAPVGPISRNHLDSGVMSPLYSIFRFTKGNLDFIEWFFNTTIWHKHMEDIANYGARADRMSFTIGDFYKMPISFPTLQEQTKVAAFLTSVNEKLQAHRKKKNLLEEYKKGVMQKLFTQELRFRDDNGKCFAEWKVKTLGEIGETYNGLTGKSKEDFGSGKPYVQYKQVFDNTKIDISRFEYVQINKNENQNKVAYGDILFTISSETPNEIGMSSVLLDKIKELYLNSFCFGYRPYSLEVLNPNYARFLFRSELFRKEVVLLAQGSTRYNLSKLEMMKLKISIPSLLEQNKIANFLSSLDNKIMQSSEQIEKIECWKKGLLQKMFC